MSALDFLQLAADAEAGSLDTVSRALGVELTSAAWKTMREWRGVHALMLEVLHRARTSPEGIGYEFAAPYDTVFEHYLAVRVGNEVTVGTARRANRKSVGFAWPELEGWKKKLESNVALATKWATEDIETDNRRVRLAVREAQRAPTDQFDERERFVDAIMSSPDDDQLRLVYADWLTERGDGQGELIRLQVLRGDQPPTAREQTILEASWRTFAGELAPWCDAASFQRGLVHTVRMTPTVFVKHGEHVFSRFPVQVLNVDANRFSAKQLLQLANAPGMPLVRELHIEKYRGVFTPLLEGKPLSSLRRLCLTGCQIDGVDWETFFMTLDAPELEAVELTGRHGHVELWRALAKGRFPKLKSIVDGLEPSRGSSDSEMSDAARLLAERRPQLERFEFASLGASASIVAPLFEAPSRVRLRVFRFSEATEALLELWERTGALREVRRLALNVAKLSLASVAHFLDAGCTPKLERLELRTYLTPTWVGEGLDVLYEALLRVPASAPLKLLSLPREYRDGHPLRAKVANRFLVARD